MRNYYYVVLFLISVVKLSVLARENIAFSKDFLFGSATSAYQIEGAWNADGKGPNIWDTYTHKFSNLIADHSNGDVACDSYHKYEEDLKAATSIGLNFYRISVSWARILPMGYVYKIRQPAIDYYNNVIDGLIARNITPMITMYHWDLPQYLQNIGGWTNPLMAGIFTDYAKLLFTYFGDRVKHWITFNEPDNICVLGYGTIYAAPGTVNKSGIADYLCGHTIIRAHADTYHLYRNQFKATQNGIVSLILSGMWYEPHSNKQEDIEAAYRKLQFTLGWFMNPIFSEQGNYPQLMIDRIGNLSRLQHLPRSRLPVFTPDEVDYIRGTYDDFVGINHYTTFLVSPLNPEPPLNEISYFNDIGTMDFQLDSWPKSATPWLKVVPWGMRKLLNYIKQEYGDIPIFITENGYADRGELKDYNRISFYKDYLNAVHEAITLDKVNVLGYTAWALIDNFEWLSGYTVKYGLVHVNFSNPELTRTPKNSARFFKRLIATHVVDFDYNGDE